MIGAAPRPTDLSVSVFAVFVGNEMSYADAGQSIPGLPPDVRETGAPTATGSREHNSQVVSVPEDSYQEQPGYTIKSTEPGSRYHMLPEQLIIIPTDTGNTCLRSPC